MNRSEKAIALDPPAHIPPAHIPQATAGAYPARAGNLVRTLIDGAEIMRRIGEAVEAARHSVWLTVAFYSDDFLFPDGRGPLFDVLDRAVARDLDVRLLVWRTDWERYAIYRTFNGSPADRELLARREARFRIRWDRAADVFCQHQKSWVIDGGQPSETAFVGGLNLTSVALQRHDVYAEVTGPSAMDVHHNFVQRWNGASEREAADGNWACDGTDTMSYPDRPAAPRGPSTVQIQRMMDARRYGEALADRSIFEQYERAIDAARRTIYIENQAIPIPPVAQRLLHALERGVAVVLLVPAVPESYVYEARLDPARAALFAGVEALGRHANFLLAGVTELDAQGRRAAYVHAKLMVVDDAWATVGSCNLHAYSLAGHTELNAAIWDVEVARGLRQTLFARHLGIDTAGLDDRAAFGIFRDRARANAGALERGQPDWQGLAFALQPALYAQPTTSPMRTS